MKSETALTQLQTERFDSVGVLSVRARFSRRLTVPTVTAIVVVVGIGILYASTLRHGHSWGDDFAMYISHARNIATGHAYTDTGYVYNPAFPQIGPRAYPPVFPLLLSPIYLIWGLRLTPMKLELVAIFAGALLACYFLFKDHLKATSSIAVLLILGLNPFFWDYKDQIMSDIPFLLFTVLTLILIQRHIKDGRLTRPRAAILIGIALWAAVGTRTVGLVLIPVLLLAELSAFRRITRHAVIALAATIACAAIQLVVFGGGIASYLDQAKPSLGSIKANAWRTTLEFERLWGSGHTHGVIVSLFWLVGALAIIGLVTRARKGLGVHEIFPLLYAIPILLWPDSRGTRFWIPLIPFYVFFALAGVEWLAGAGRPRIVNVAVGGVTAVLLTSYGAGYGVLDHGTLPAGVGVSSSVRMFAFVKAETAPGSVVIFMKPRALALFTGHPSSAYQPALPLDDQWRYFERIGARYVVDGPGATPYLSRLLSRYRLDVTLVYRNGDFGIYRIDHFG